MAKLKIVGYTADEEGVNVHLSHKLLLPSGTIAASVFLTWEAIANTLSDGKIDAIESSEYARRTEEKPNGQ